MSLRIQPFRTTRRHAAIGMLFVCCALVATACGSSGKATSSTLPTAQSSDATVAAASSDLGDILIAGDGKTLYLFEKASCTGACAKAWPPYAAASAVLKAGPGVKASLLHTVRRPDGSEQVTYNGHALYTFSGDSKPGDAKGQGSDAFGAHWYTVSPQGSANETKAKSDKPTGYGY
jgi:predicted lipoprotein with Yx(FWY)xxD motif